MTSKETAEGPMNKSNGTSGTNSSPRKVNDPLERPADPEKAEVASDKTESTSGSRRPVTRSLSGRPIKRRIWEDNATDLVSLSGDDSDSNRAEHTPAPKKQKTMASSRRTTRKSVAAAAAAADKASISASSSQVHESSENNSVFQSVPPQASGGGSTEAAMPMSMSASTSTATFISQSVPQPSSLSSTPPLVATRIGTARAMRATLPTPVPNLTKKSRGRRVPVRVVSINGMEVIQDPPPVSSPSNTMAPGSSNGTADSANPKAKRSYVCSVEGCGKCFHRGEHLKRHIRSIHTHEKPFKCTYPECDKNFNRHDNLLQHLKVHKQAQATAAMTASGAPVTLDPNGKGKVKSKSKGSAESAGAGSKSRSKNGKGRRKKRRRSSSPEDVDDEEGESEAESAEIASSDEEDDADEASAVSNLLSLRANASGLKGAPTLVAPLHHNLTSYTPSLGSMASTATVVGSVSGWGYPSSSSSSTFTPNGNTITGSKPYFSPFQTSFNPHKSYSSMFTPNGVNNPMPQFSLSKAYSSGTTPYEASISASADHADGIPDAADLHNGYHHNGIGHVQNTVSNVRSVNEMSDSEQLGAFQSDMAMSSLRSTSSALRSTNGLEGLNGSNGLDLDKGAVGRTHSLTPPSRLGSEGRENRDRVMNLDPTLAAMDMQSKHAVINKASESPTNDIDAINASSESNSNSPLVCDSTSTPTPVHKPTSVTSIGSQNAEQGAANFVDSDFQSNRQTYMSPMESNGTEPRTTLRPVESEKDWRM